jgi:hypothetical protein
LSEKFGFKNTYYLYTLIEEIKRID